MSGVEALRKIHAQASQDLGAGVHTRAQWAAATKKAAEDLRSRGEFKGPHKIKKPPGPIALRHKEEKKALRVAKSIVKALPDSSEKSALLAKFPEPKHKYSSEAQKEKRKAAYAARPESKVEEDKAKARARYDKKQALLGKTARHLV
jgi:hypothetical protein